MRKIVVLDGYALNPGDLSWDKFKQLGEVCVFDDTRSSDVLTNAYGAECILVNKVQLSGDILLHLPELKYIGVLATGYDVVDVSMASKLGIAVTNIPAYGTAAVSQHAFALLLELCNYVGYHNQAVQKGKWASSGSWCFYDYPLLELEGKNVGIVGFGRIGKKTASIASAFGMNVFFYDPDADETQNYSKCFNLEELLQLSDVLFLHCPLTKDNEGMINRETLSIMRQSSIIINNSRGKLIVEEDLSEALRSGRIRAAAIDVSCSEPIIDDNPLLGLENCIITPHISWASIESRARLMNMAFDNYKQYLDGKIYNRVDFASNLEKEKIK